MLMSSKKPHLKLSILHRFHDLKHFALLHSMHAQLTAEFENFYRKHLLHLLVLSDFLILCGTCTYGAGDILLSTYVRCTRILDSFSLFYANVISVARIIACSIIILSQCLRLLILQIQCCFVARHQIVWLMATEWYATSFMQLLYYQWAVKVIMRSQEIMIKQTLKS